MTTAVGSTTARERLEALRAGDLRVAELIAAGMPLHVVLDALVRVIEEQADGMLGSILLLEDGVRVRHGAAPNLPKAFVDAIDGLEIGPAAGSCGTAAWRREPVIVEDIATDPLWARYRDGALAAGLRACWSVPIQSRDQRVLGTFALYYREPRRPTPELLDLTRHASSLASIAIEKHLRDQALWVSQQQLALIYEHVEDVLYTLRVEAPGAYRFETINPSFTRATGLRSEEVVGRRVEDVFPEPSLSRVRQGYAEALATGRTVRWDESTEYPAGTRHGEVAVTPVFGADGTVRHLIGSIRDVTERRRLEEEMRQLQKMEAISRLSGGIAHDFNNLLSVVLMSGTALLDEVTGTPQRSLVQEILGAAERGAELTRQILAISRKQVMRPMVLDLNAVITGLDRILARLLGEDLTVTFRLARDLWPVAADRGRLEQVLLNLAVNARDAMPSGGTLTIATHNVLVGDESVRDHATIPAGAWVVLSVADTGVGMDAETAAHAFEPFFTTKSSDRGTGLGLATVYGIVKQTGGEVSVHSAPGEGSTFRIYLPRSRAVTRPPAERTEDLGRAERAERRISKRVTIGHVLVVEDEPALRAMFARLIPQLRCRVTVAASAEEGLRLLGDLSSRPDVIITDVVLPGMSGVEFGAAVRALPAPPPIIYISGFPEGSEPARAGLPKGAPFLSKPFSIGELGALIEDVLTPPV